MSYFIKDVFSWFESVWAALTIYSLLIRVNWNDLVATLSLKLSSFNDTTISKLFATSRSGAWCLEVFSHSL